MNPPLQLYDEGTEREMLLALVNGCIPAKYLARLEPKRHFYSAIRKEIARLALDLIRDGWQTWTLDAIEQVIEEQGLADAAVKNELDAVRTRCVVTVARALVLFGHLEEMARQRELLVACRRCVAGLEAGVFNSDDALAQFRRLEWIKEKNR